jgi:hypothetical protein
MENPAIQRCGAINVEFLGLSAAVAASFSLNRGLEQIRLRLPRDAPKRLTLSFSIDALSSKFLLGHLSASRGFIYFVLPAGV